jgi:dihydroorotase
MADNDDGFDLILRGGRVVDPAAGRDAVCDVGLRDGRIAAVAADLGAAREVLDVTGATVLPGLIDTHAHVYQYVTGRFGLNADMCGVRSGVATLVDQGGPSAMTLPGFRKFVVEPAKSRVVCFISAYLVGGLEGHYYPSLYGPEQVDVKATVNAALENRDIVKGIKAHGEIGGASRWGVEVMRLAKEISREAGLPLYVHLGQIWPTKDNAAVDPNAVVRDVVALMQAGDVLAHPFTRHPGGFISEETGKVHPVVWDALERGVRVDVGHGSHFSFKMARMALEQGIVPYTLGADLHGYNVTVPGEGKGDGAKQSNPFYGVAPFSLCHAMTELMTLGMPFFEVVKMVTSHAAELIGMSETVGTLAPGRDADVSVIDRVPGAWELRDNSGDRVIAREAIVPRFVLRKGMRFEPDSPILARPAAA